MSDKKKYDFILFGGDRVHEKGPISELSIFLKKKKYSYIVIIDKAHANKKVDFKINLKKYLNKKRINYLIIESLSDINLKRFIKKKTIGLSINAIWKFPEKIIKLFNGNLYNYHAADLPSERGGANISWRIMLNKKKDLSINIHKIEKDFDTGDIVKTAKVYITNKEKLPFHHLKKIKQKENKFLKQFIVDCILKKKFMKKKQKNLKSFYWPTLKSDRDGQINWSWTAKEIVQFIRAFSKPYNGAFSYLGKKKVRIFNASFIRSKIKFHPFQSGIIFKFHKNFFYIANRNYYLKIFIKDITGLKKNLSFYLGKRFFNK